MYTVYTLRTVTQSPTITRQKSVFSIPTSPPLRPSTPITRQLLALPGSHTPAPARCRSPDFSLGITSWFPFSFTPAHDDQPLGCKHRQNSSSIVAEPRLESASHSVVLLANRIERSPVSPTKVVQVRPLKFGKSLDRRVLPCLTGIGCNTPASSILLRD